ncbi:unnamed protein product [Brassica oleracea]
MIAIVRCCSSLNLDYFCVTLGTAIRFSNGILRLRLSLLPYCRRLSAAARKFSRSRVAHRSPNLDSMLLCWCL